MSALPPPPFTYVTRVFTRRVWKSEQPSQRRLRSGIASLLAFPGISLLVSLGVVLMNPTMDKMRDSDATRTAVRLAAQDPRVTALAGTPLPTVSLLSGNIHTEQGVGSASLWIAVKGPLASGTIMTAETSHDGVWRPTLLVFRQDRQPAAASVMIVNEPHRSPESLRPGTL